MLTFFRNIRRKLATDNEFFQYSRYAVGEIVLVMIGILLALQVNNWNEERKQGLAVNSALESLVNDLLIQQELIAEQQAYEMNRIEEVKTVMSNMVDPNINEVGRLMDSLTSRHTFVMMRSSFKNLETSGGLNTIEDLSVQNNIIRYFQLLDYTTSVTNNNNLYLIDNLFGNFVITNPFHLGLSKQGSVFQIQPITEEERYTILINLEQRLQASESIEKRIRILGKETEKLISQIQEYLKF